MQSKKRKMKIKILEYKIHRGNKVKVQSHNFRKGKWIENKKYDWHKKVASGITMLQGAVLGVKEYSREVKE